MPVDYVRSALAIVAGYLVLGLASAVLFPLVGYDAQGGASLPFRLFGVAYGAIFAAVGGYVSAALAPRRPAAHAVVLAILLAAGALLAALATPNGDHWAHVGVVILMAPAAALGGIVRERRDDGQP